MVTPKDLLGFPCVSTCLLLAGLEGNSSGSSGDASEGNQTASTTAPPSGNAAMPLQIIFAAIAVFVSFVSSKLA